MLVRSESFIIRAVVTQNMEDTEHAEREEHLRRSEPADDTQADHPGVRPAKCYASSSRTRNAEMALKNLFKHQSSRIHVYDDRLRSGESKQTLAVMFPGFISAHYDNTFSKYQGIDTSGRPPRFSFSRHLRSHRAHS